MTSPAPPGDFAVRLATRGSLTVPLVAMAAFVFATAVGAMVLTRDGFIASVWVADAAILTMMVRGDRARTPLIAIVAWLTLVAANLAGGDRGALAFALPLCNVAAAIIAARIIRPAWERAPHPSDGRTLGAIMLGGGLVAPLVSAAAGALLLNGIAGAPLVQMFERWVAAQALGMLLCAPVLLGIGRRDLATLDTRTVAMGAAIVMFNSGIATLIFSSTTLSMLFLTAPGLILAAFRTRFLGAALSLVMVAIVATTFTIAGVGPIGTLPLGPPEQILFLQFFLVVMLLTVLPVSAILDGQLRLARRLEENNRLLLLAERTARMGHWRLDRRTRGVRWSDNVHIIRGTEPADGEMDRGVATYLPEEQPRVRAFVEHALATGEPLSFRSRITRTDGAVIAVAVEGIAEYGADGEIAGLFGVLQDVTAQADAEAELKAALATAEDANRAKSDFLAMMSHEIRTPMTGVLGMIELLRTEPSAAERERYFTTLDQSARVLLAVLNDVLDYSRLESGAVQLEQAPFDLHRLVTSVVALFHSSASAKGLLVTADLPDAQPLPVTGDAVRVQQVLSNLVGNAIKFTPTGAIVVRVRVPEDGQDDCWRFEVADTGIGIPPEAIERLFDPFVQADASTARRFGGSGLGLAICRRLVEAMGGEIGVASTPGAGSTFRFSLPLPLADASTLDEARALPPGPAARPMVILLAEDNDVVALLGVALLQRMGHRVTRVADGDQAVDAAAAGGFDAVLMDMQMPVLDGLEATRRIRALPGPERDVPIIALTADAAPARRMLYEGAGLSGFLGKPIDPIALAAALAGIARGSDAASEDTAPVLPLLDPARIADTAALLGDTGVLRLLDMLRVDCEHRAALVLAHFGAGELEALRREAHALAGAADIAGAARLGAASRALMDEAIGPADLPPLLAKLAETAALTRRAIADVTSAPLAEQDAAE